MSWINVADKLPKIGGKYVVRTATLKGNYNIFETVFNVVSETFTVSNQIVTHWLDHDFDFKADIQKRIKK